MDGVEDWPKGLEDIVGAAVWNKEAPVEVEAPKGEVAFVGLPAAGDWPKMFGVKPDMVADD